MSELLEALSEAFGQEPGVPAEPDLGRGIRATGFWSFAPSLEIVIANRDEVAWHTLETLAALLTSPSGRQPQQSDLKADPRGPDRDR